MEPPGAHRWDAVAGDRMVEHVATMTADSPTPLFGNVVDASKDTRGWFLGHFMLGESNPLRTGDVELKWYTHPREIGAKSGPLRAPYGRSTSSSGSLRSGVSRSGALWRKKAISFPSVLASYIFRSLEESLVRTVRRLRRHNERSWVSPRSSSRRRAAVPRHRRRVRVHDRVHPTRRRLDARAQDVRSGRHAA